MSDIAAQVLLIALFTALYVVQVIAVSRKSVESLFQVTWSYSLCCYDYFHLHVTLCS